MIGETVGFEMRTFRFVTDEDSSSEEQEQTVRCDLHLEPAAAAEQARVVVEEEDCSCHTVKDCESECQGYF